MKQDKLIIYTIGNIVKDVTTLNEVRDEIFTQKLGAKIENLNEIKPGFVVANMDKLTFPTSTSSKHNNK